MSSGWVAGTVRARAMARRRIGVHAARRIAACESLDQALRILAATPYAEPARYGRADAGGRADAALAAAQHAVAEALLWDLRVMAGWLPPGGAQLMRALAGWFEIANVDELLQELRGLRAGEFFTLGALATAWPRLRRAASLADLRAALAASAWKDPGGDTETAVAVGLRASWALRVEAIGEPARTWAAGAVAMLLAAERFGAERRPAGPVLWSAARSLLGQGAAEAVTFEELARRLPGRLSWALEPAMSGGDQSDDGRAGAHLYLAEARWWARVERDGLALLAGSGLDRRPVLGAVAVLAADARRVRAALASAARGGALEAFDAVA